MKLSKVFFSVLNYISGIKKELLFTLFFLLALLVFPWVAFFLVRLIATLTAIHPNSIPGNLMSIIPNLVIAGLGIAFLKTDNWDFSVIGLHFRKLIPAIVFIVFALAGLYIILPLGMAIFFEPRTLVVSFQGFTPLFLVLFLRSWLFVGISEEIAARGFLLNKLYSLFPKKGSALIKKWIAVILTMLFFSLVNYIRLRTAGNVDISTNTLLVYFVFGLAVSFFYLRTNNLFIAGFMQSAFIFPPMGLVVGKVFSLSSFGFIVSAVAFIAYLVILTETYSFWGKALEGAPSTNDQEEDEALTTKAEEETK